MIKKFEENCSNRETFLKGSMEYNPGAPKEVKKRDQFLSDEDLNHTYERTTMVESFSKRDVKMGLRPNIVKKYEDFCNDK